jgi:archaellum component FlaC
MGIYRERIEKEKIGIYDVEAVDEILDEIENDINRIIDEIKDNNNYTKDEIIDDLEELAKDLF